MTEYLLDTPFGILELNGLLDSSLSDSYLASCRWRMAVSVDSDGLCVNPDGLPDSGLQELALAMTGYFKGHSAVFSSDAFALLDWKTMTPFSRAVREACLSIPYGETRTYQELAVMVGAPQASRAVGRAMATNPYHVLIPCHRVVGASGHLTGYAGGLTIKQRLLDWEKSQLQRQRPPQPDFPKRTAEMPEGVAAFRA